MKMFYWIAGIKGILTESRKRKYKQTQQSKHEPTIEDKEQDQKNPWGALSETWGKNDIVEDDFLPKNGFRDGAKDQGRSIKERLGIKYADKDAMQSAEESGETNSSSDSDEDWCRRSKIPRMRMHADDEEEKVQKRRAKLRYQVSYLFSFFLSIEEETCFIVFFFFYFFISPTNSVLSFSSDGSQQFEYQRWFAIKVGKIENENTVPRTHSSGSYESHEIQNPR